MALYIWLTYQVRRWLLSKMFGKVMPLELSSFKGFHSFPSFFVSLLTDTHLIFGTLLCHAKIHIKCEFGLDSLISHEVMALGRRKISRIISFPACFSLSAYGYSFDIWYTVHCFAILSCRSSSSGYWLLSLR
jgi:hypothetical protein